MSVQFTIKPFDKLTAIDVYYILLARSQIFVVEQNCVYQDIDDLDFDCLHLVAHKDATLIGYCRIIPPDINPRVTIGTTPKPAIGRLLVMPEHRGTGLGKEIMLRAIKYCKAEYPKQSIVISAQTQLVDFYKSLNFEVFGTPHLEDGIEHVEMILNTQKKQKISEQKVAIPKTLSFVLIFLGLLTIALIIYLMI